MIQSRPNCCPHCDSRAIIKRGVRSNQYRQLQIYWCKDCLRHFTPMAGSRGAKYPPHVIASALSLYHLGRSQEEVSLALRQRYHLAVPRRTISDWLRQYRTICTFSRLRAEALRSFPPPFVEERVLDHQQVYRFRVHRAKLGLLSDAVPEPVLRKVRNYLLSVTTDFPDDLFRDSAPGVATPLIDQTSIKSIDGGYTAPAERRRSSKTTLETLPFVYAEKHNLANDLALMGLWSARTNRDRHEAVQGFMLANDSSTVACEVPVYLLPDEVAYFKSRGFQITLPEVAGPSTGHIDALQARNGFVHILDYKPKARSERPVSQLLLYALALASRTRLPLKAFKCAWFDERDYFEFFPLQAVSGGAHARPV